MWVCDLVPPNLKKYSKHFLHARAYWAGPRNVSMTLPLFSLDLKHSDSSRCAIQLGFVILVFLVLTWVAAGASNYKILLPACRNRHL